MCSEVMEGKISVIKNEKKKRKKTEGRSKQAKYATIRQSAQKSNPRHRVCVTSNSHCKRPNSQSRTTSFDKQNNRRCSRQWDCVFLAHQRHHLQPRSAHATEKDETRNRKQKQGAATASRVLCNLVTMPTTGESDGGLHPFCPRLCLSSLRVSSLEDTSTEHERRRGKTNGGVLLGDSGDGSHLRVIVTLFLRVPDRQRCIEGAIRMHTGSMVAVFAHARRASNVERERASSMGGKRRARDVALDETKLEDVRHC